MTRGKPYAICRGRIFESIRWLTSSEFIIALNPDTSSNIEISLCDDADNDDEGARQQTTQEHKRRCSRVMTRTPATQKDSKDLSVHRN